MAQRPVFLPYAERAPWVREVMIDFTWFRGMSMQQKQRSVRALHEAARIQGIAPILEISTKSVLTLGKSLSAFNLTMALDESVAVAVEAVFQSSKVFVRGGPYRDLLSLSGREIKKDPRLTQSGHLVAFDLAGMRWPLEPKTAFYDWLYINALHQHPALSEAVLQYRGFTDIEFNPRKSVNCQARSAALYIALRRNKALDEALLSREAYLQVVIGKGQAPQDYAQSQLI